jgi:TRAP-type C4-dicarboxylate transport system substrate-binding protein
MNDDQLLHEVASWLVDGDPTPPDARESVRRAMARTPRVRQRGRWWPLPIIGRSGGPPTMDQTTDLWPRPIPATNGHTATVIGRTQTMFSPAKAITAAVLVVGIGGALLIIQPFHQEGSSAPGAATDAGTPLALTLALQVDMGEPVQPAIDAFVEQVDRLSDGSIAIEPLYGAGHATSAGGEAGVASLLRRGEADLALIGSRAWDLTGATSLQALQAPFLITDDALAEAVATSDIAERALAGLSDAGVVGLSLWPEDLRHPFALGGHAPFLSPGDFEGAMIVVQPSVLSYSLITKLGASLYDDDSLELDAAEGRLHGAESGLLQGHTLPGPPTATGDVTFFPKFQMIAASAGMFDALTDEQQAILRDAALETQRVAIETRTSEADAAAAWCDAGGTIVLAGEAAVAAFEAAAEPIYRVMERDPLNAALIADIEALKATTTPAPGATACAPDTVSSR